MTAHELAALLLEGPDLPVVVEWPDGGPLEVRVQELCWLKDDAATDTAVVEEARYVSLG